MQLLEIIPFAGVLIAAFVAWWNIRKDTEAKIESCRSGLSQEIVTLRSKLENVQTQYISRAEHEKDIERVRDEIRAFRSEVREDLKNLNVALTARFDLLMQRLTDGR